MTQTPQYVSQPTQNTVQELVQNDVNTLPQASPSQNSASFVNTQGVRGGRGGYRGRGVQYCVTGVETSYLRSKLVIKWLNVPIRNKPRIAG